MFSLFNVDLELLIKEDIVQVEVDVLCVFVMF